jgi:hypothetical protein
MTLRKILAGLFVVALAVVAFYLIGLFFQTISGDGGRSVMDGVGTLVPTIGP